MGAPELCKSDPGICHGATEGTEVKRACVGDGAWGGSGRGRRRAGFFATFTAHDSRRSTRGQLYGVTVEVQLAGGGRSEGDARKMPRPLRETEAQRGGARDIRASESRAARPKELLTLARAVEERQRALPGRNHDDRL